jgi:hypothetical protein
MAKTPEFNLSANYGKNYIINGDMRIAQRGTSFASIANNTWSLDRWLYNKSGALVHTVTQDSNVPTATQAGYLFQNSLKLNLTTALPSVGASEYCQLLQTIEGYNFVHIAQKPFTLSFWVKASIPGIYCVAFRSAGIDRSYVAEYTINAADTWEFKSVTVSASPSAGTWNYSNGTGLYVSWTLAGGTTLRTTPGSWQTGNYIASTNQVNGVSTTTASLGVTDFRLTGIMVTEGSQALPFRLFSGGSYPDELMACQRYYEIGQDFYSSGVTVPAGSFYFGYKSSYKVPKRGTPVTVTVTDHLGAAGKVTMVKSTTATDAGISPSSINSMDAQGFIVNPPAGTNVYCGIWYYWFAESETT